MPVPNRFSLFQAHPNSFLGAPGRDQGAKGVRKRPWRLRWCCSRSVQQGAVSDLSSVSLAARPLAGVDLSTFLFTYKFFWDWVFHSIFTHSRPHSPLIGLILCFPLLQPFFSLGNSPTSPPKFVCGVNSGNCSSELIFLFFFPPLECRLYMFNNSPSLSLLKMWDTR